MKTAIAATLKRPVWVLSITVEQHALPKGHQPHKSGVGTHGDRRTKRNRTRSQQRQAALGEW